MEEAQPAAEAPRRLGRPTREEAALRQAELLEKALDMFLERGFEQTTIEGIAIALNMTKRTIYSRYGDKETLFKAAVRQAIEREIVPRATLESLEADDLEETLLAVARFRIAHVITPQAQKLQRVLNAESFRFPELVAATYDLGSRPVIEFVAEVLSRHDAKGTIKVDRPEMASMVFLGMVVGALSRRMTAGILPDPADVEDRLTYSVKLFLDAVRVR